MEGAFSTQYVREVEQLFEDVFDTGLEEKALEYKAITDRA